MDKGKPGMATVTAIFRYLYGMSMPLNLPPAALKLKEKQVWDRLRRRYVPLTPEEWVRQHFIAYLIDHLSYPEGRMASEYVVTYNDLKKRCDIVAFGADFQPLLVVECKAPAVAVTEETFFQLARYVSSLKAKMIILTNGMDHYCAWIDGAGKGLVYLKEIPAFPDFPGQQPLQG